MLCIFSDSNHGFSAKVTTVDLVIYNFTNRNILINTTYSLLTTKHLTSSDKVYLLFNATTF